MPGDIQATSTASAAVATPAETGITSDQKATQVINADLTIADWREQSPLSGTLHELAVTASQNSRTTFMMAEAASRIVEEDARELRRKLREVELKLEESEKARYQVREENAVLRERLKTADLKTAMLSLGTLALGAAISIYVSPQGPPASQPYQIGCAHVLAVIAAILILTAFIVPSLRKSA